MSREWLRGLRCVGHLRCSTLEQALTSIGQQRGVLTAFASDVGMYYVGDIELRGVSGSTTESWRDFESLIRRKSERDDYDVLLVDNLARITRMGPDFGGKVVFELGQVGVQIVSVAEDIPDGDCGWLHRALGFESANATAKAISRSSSRGAMSSIIKNYVPYARKAPYGIDRMIVGADERPLFLMRCLEDGTQLQLDPTGTTILRRFPRNEPERFMHYRKRPEETVKFVPGAPECVEVVRRILKRHHVEGWGGLRIACELNDLKRLSPRGRMWSITAVDKILNNPIYVGRGVANQISKATYNMRGKSQPVSVPRRRPTPHRKTKSEIYRGPDEWVVMEYPELANIFIDVELQEQVWEKCRRRLIRLADGMAGKSGGDSHCDSPYILKGILRAKQGNHMMSGQKSTHARYYRAKAYVNYPSSDSARKILTTMIHADVLEKAVLQSLQQTLVSSPNVESEVRAHILHLVRQSEGERQEVPQLIAQRDELWQRIDFAMTELRDLGREVVKQKVAPLKDKHRMLDARIEALQSQHPPICQNPDAIVANVTRRLKYVASCLDGASRPFLKRVLRAFIHDMVADLADRSVEWFVAVPDWTILQAEKGDSADWPVPPLDFKTTNWPSGRTAVLDRYRCTFSHFGRRTRAHCTKVD